MESRRVVAGLVLGLSLPVLTGCGIEAKDVEDHEHTSVQSANYTIDGVAIRNAYITTPLTTAKGKSGTTAYLVVTFVNDGKQTNQLTEVSTPLGVATIPQGSLALPPGVAVRVSDPDIDSSLAAIPISGKTPVADTTVAVTFSFTPAGSTGPIQVPVVAPEGLSLSPTTTVPTGRATPPSDDAPLASD